MLESIHQDCPDEYTHVARFNSVGAASAISRHALLILANVFYFFVDRITAAALYGAARRLVPGKKRSRRHRSRQLYRWQKPWPLRTRFGRLKPLRDRNLFAACAQAPANCRSNGGLAPTSRR